MTTKQDTERDGVLAGLGLLIAAAAFVAAVAFVLSFIGLDDYGRRVAGEGHLSFLVPLGIDGLTMVGVIATYKLRTAPWHMRLYAWLVFSIALGASVAGNLSHAMAHHLSRSGQVGAVVWPVFFAASSHVVIVVRRWQETRRRMLAARPAVALPVAEHETAGDKRAAAKPLTPEQYTRRMTGEGWTVSKIHRALSDRGDNVSRSTVGRWAKEARFEAEVKKLVGETKTEVAS